MSYLLSVVIPTYARETVFRNCLDRILSQSIPAGSYEVIVVDDSPTDETRKITEAFAAETGTPVKFLRGAGRGVSAARNLGVKASSGEIVVIIGNDIIVETDFLAQHLRFHRMYPDPNYGVLGQTKLHPNTAGSPFMKIWGDLPFWEIADKIEVPCTYFWTGNVSFKRQFFQRYGLFDEEFRRIGFEDVEVGLRLSRHGFRLMYNKDALGYHDHAYSVEEACRQQINHGYNFGVLVNKLKAQGFHDQVPFMGERFGIIGLNHSWRGVAKSFIKKWILHRKLFMIPLKGWLRGEQSPGRLARFMYPKLFTYYTNLGYYQHKREARLK